MLQSSRNSLAATVERADAAIDAGHAKPLGDGLLGVVGVLAEAVHLRRALADAAVADSAKSALVQSLFGDQVAPEVLDLVGAVVQMRWARAQDMLTGLETAGVRSLAALAQSEERLGQVEEELFRFGRTLDANGALEQALSDSAAPLEKREQLLGSLIDDKVGPLSAELLHGVLANPRARSMYNSVQGLIEDAAARRRRSVAVVKSPIALSDQQEQRLTASLARIYGREIAVSVDVDPSLLGGLRVQVGDDVIDGSVAGRLDDIQRRFAG